MATDSSCRTVDAVHEDHIVRSPCPLRREQFQRHHWISDITTGAFSKVLSAGADTTQSIRHVQASDCLQGEQILEVLQRHGWTTDALRSYITDVGFVQERVRRMMGGATPPPRPQFPPGDPTGVLRFARS